MRVCMLSKFPPTEGGISSRSYWLARGLAQNGIKLQIVTNADSVERDYRIDGCNDHIKSMKGIEVFNLQEEMPWHIPYSEDYLSRLINTTLLILEKEKADLIDTGYLVPFGIAGWLTSKITGLPYIVRHGGSDIGKFLEHADYRGILKKVIAEASAVVTDKQFSNTFKNVARNIVDQPAYAPSEQFVCEKKSTGKTTFAYIGKVNFHWERKGLAKIVELFDEVPGETYDLVFVAQGKGLDAFLASLDAEQRGRIDLRQFVPPWEMPELLSGIDYVFDISEKDPILSESFLVKEATLAGVRVISNRSMDSGETIMWPLEKDALARLLKSPRKVGAGHPRKDIDYDQWISMNIELYKDLR